MINKYRAPDPGAQGVNTMPTVYQTASPGEAQVRVALVTRGKADLLVHRVSTRGLAHGEALWYITRDRQEANVRICFVSEGMSELRICFVDSIGEAGWQRPRPRRINLG
jgi:hypothetical protein